MNLNCIETFRMFRKCFEIRSNKVNKKREYEFSEMR